MDSNLFDMRGKVAVVTGAGANGGLGHIIALAFAQHGADILAGDIDDAGNARTVEEVRALGRKAFGVHCDVSKEEDVAGLFEEADRQFG